ncbi:MAG TPA: efflux RND transporter permease subunit, partial [Myxococcota bacterium]|nr:efflux RND transporter permease subunit [Myxococcota bacterium]
GAGGDARAPMGIAVVGGVFFSTLLTFFLAPATYLVLDRAQQALAAARARRRPPAAAPARP